MSCRALTVLKFDNLSDCGRMTQQYLKDDNKFDIKRFIPDSMIGNVDMSQYMNTRTFPHDVAVRTAEDGRPEIALMTDGGAPVPVIAEMMRENPTLHIEAEWSTNDNVGTIRKLEHTPGTGVVDSTIYMPDQDPYVMDELDDAELEPSITSSDPFSLDKLKEMIDETWPQFRRGMDAVNKQRMAETELQGSIPAKIGIKPPDMTAEF